MKKLSILLATYFMVILLNPISSRADTIQNSYDVVNLYGKEIKVSSDVNKNYITDLPETMVKNLPPEGIITSVDTKIISFNEYNEPVNFENIAPYGYIPKSQLGLRLYLLELPDSSGFKNYYVSALAIWSPGQEPFWRLTDYLSLVWSDEFNVVEGSISTNMECLDYNGYSFTPDKDTYGIKEHVPKTLLVGYYDLKMDYSPNCIGLGATLRKPITGNGDAVIVAQYNHTIMGTGSASVNIGVSGTTPTFSFGLGLGQTTDYSDPVIRNMVY